ncbi:hypothetical protein [Ulvibacterium sp.]|uniref:hypothetical protein n=1 Tax=Ulvibacterium sp. TaxID=2665914 RepID=UPI0026068C6E|nr:hypothetical protein [Ulvibacterium sp.]
MNRKILLTIISAILGFSALGQTGLQANPSGDTENNFRLANYFHTLSNKPEAIMTDRTVDLADIEGSMYYDEDFSLGKIYYANKPFKSILARYNAYTDEIEIKRDEGEAVESLFKGAKVSCEINGQRFVYSEYLDKRGNLENGYLVKTFSGEKYDLYEKKSKAFKEGQQPKTSLHLPTPDKFVDRLGFYVAVDSETPRFFPDSKKKLSTTFEENKVGILKTFIKRNEIDLSKKEDLQRLLSYAEIVTSEGKGA